MATTVSPKANTKTRRPDQILTDDKGYVSINSLAPDTVITIHGRAIKASQIPLSFFALDCGHRGKGIALALNDVVFCEECGVNRFVSKTRS